MASCGFLGCGAAAGAWCDARLMCGAGDEMMRCSCPRAFSLSFSFRPAPSPRLSLICLLRLVPPPSGSGDAWANVDLRLLAAGPVCLPVIIAIPLSRYRSFAFSRRSAIGAVVGLRPSASLLASSRRRLCCRAVSYSIPDEMMLITGSCGIRLVRPSCLLAAVVSVLRAMWAVVGPPLVPPLVSSGGSASRPCLLDVIRRMPRCFAPPVISSLVLGCLPFSACLGSCLFPLSPSSMSVPVLLPPHGFSLPAPPHRHDGRGDTTVPWRLPRLCLLAPFGSPSHPCGSASDGDVALVLASLHGHHRCRLLTARSPNQISSPSCRPAASSPPSPITRHGGRGGGLFARVLCIAAAGVALLAWVSYYLFCRWGMW